MSILLAVMATALFQQPSCEALKSVSLPKATITAAEFVPANAPQSTAGPRCTGCGIAGALSRRSDACSDGGLAYRDGIVDAR